MVGVGQVSWQQVDGCLWLALGRGQASGLVCRRSVRVHQIWRQRNLHTRKGVWER